MLVLPDFYDENILGFYPQGPGCVFVYWELSDFQWKALNSMNGKLIIRLLKLVEDKGFDYKYLTVSQVEPPAATYSWYFTGLEPDAMYNVEICSLHTDGIAIPLLKSDKIATPPLPEFDPAPKSEIPLQKSALDLCENNQDLCSSNMTGLQLGTNDVFDKMPFYMGVSPMLAG